jgi:hypothetical protein
MDDRFKEIENLTDRVDFNYYKKVEQKRIARAIVRYPELEGFSPIHSDEFQTGLIIRFVDLRLKKLSPPYAMVAIEYYPTFLNLRVINKVYVFNKTIHIVLQLYVNNFLFFVKESGSDGYLRYILQKQFKSQIDKYIEKHKDDNRSIIEKIEV